MTYSDADIFADALERPFTEREAFVVGACGGDLAQRERVLGLLLAHEKAEVKLRTSFTQRLPEPVSETGTTIGRYKLLEKIGEGGCGVVWMAQQEEPVRRRVALKVIKLGMDTKEVIARFEAERQALALMEHPNIAKVFDAGATETGRPYFVMELVHGLPITRYCDQRNMTTTDRLNLFVQVCRALQHAHEKGIVHRDIKPSNILVTNDGDAPLPKVIDFGIAKAAQGRLTDRTLFTAFEQFIGTPAYMSPEQADYHASEIDARSDVYSLGALLYELIAGRPPFDPKALASQGMNEVRLILREVDPPRPSTQLTTLALAERTTLALRRGLMPVPHVLAIKGDLDWIAMKALEKNRTRRYESAAAFAADVQRHLEDQPVMARPPSAVYRAQKFARRHLLALVAASAVLLALVLGGTTSLWQSRRADRAENQREALAEKNRGSPLVQLVESGRAARPMPPDPASPAALARAREFIADVRENYFHDSLLETREVHVQERAEETFAALGLVPAEARWPEWARERGIVSARLALAERRQARGIASAHAQAACVELETVRAAGDTSDDASVLLAMARVTEFDPILAHRVGGQPERNKRTAALRQAEALVLPLVLAGHDRARHVLAEVLLAAGEYRGGIESARNSLALAMSVIDEIGETERIQPRVLLTRAKIVMQLGEIALPEENERRQREALAIAEALLAQQPQLAAAQRVKFWVHHSLGRERPQIRAKPALLAEAEKLAFALHQRDLSSDDDWYLLLIIRRLLAAQFMEEGRISDAAAVWHRTAVDGGHPATLPEPPTGRARRFIYGVLNSTALLEASRGNAGAAEQAFRAQQMYALGVSVGPEASPRTALAFNSLGEARRTLPFKVLRGDYDGVIAEGQALLAQLRSLVTGPATKPHDRVVLRTDLDYFREAVAEALIQRGRFAEAETMLVSTSELLPPTPYPFTPPQRIWLALAQARQARQAEALVTLQPSMANLRREYDAGMAKSDRRELFARALFVEAVAQPATEAGGARRQAALGDAQKILDAMTAEARQLYNPRVLLKWIAEERAR